MASPLQFRNFVVFDHIATGIETKTIRFSENVNSHYRNILFDETNGPAIIDSIVIGNSDQNALTNSDNGIVLAWDRGLLVKNVNFYNFPDQSTQAMRATIITGRCS